MSVSTGITPHTEISVEGVQMGWVWVQKLCLTTQWRIQDLPEGINLLFGQMFRENCKKIKEFRSATTTICASSIMNRYISYWHSYSNQWFYHSQWLHKIIPRCYSAIRGWWTIRRAWNYDPSCEYCARAAQCRKTLTFSPSGSKKQFFLDGAEISLNSVNSADSGNLIISWSMN